MQCPIVTHDNFLTGKKNHPVIQAKELAQQVQATTSADFECITTDYHEFSSILF